MVNKEMYSLGSKRSVIRELFEYGKLRAAELGADNVYDFSLGNPSVPTPDCVTQALENMVLHTDAAELHSYTSAQGDLNVRRTVAEHLTNSFGVKYTSDNIYMTCGAAAALAITVKALCEKDDEFIVFAPYFPEYQVFIKSAGGTPVTVGFDKSFLIDFDSLEKALTPHTKAIIVNSPNNPSGVIYKEETIKKLVEVLNRYSQKFGHPIYIIADEPYRELVYDLAEIPFIPSYYDNTLFCYSFSKSLSLPGERIGYIAVSPKAAGAEDIYAAVMGAGRALGYVCAPALFQKVVARCMDAKPNISAYKENRDLLLNGLRQIGYDCVQPDGAFYLFIKSPTGDSIEFSQKAKEFGLLIVPGDDFAASGWMRLAYCVSKDLIERAMPAFKQLYDSCR